MAGILIIDDDPDALAILRTFLRSHGHQVADAATGSEGLDMLEEVAPDLVILDVMMPGMDGWEVARRIRQRRGPAETRILMLTARDGQDDRRESFDAGADTYLVKPVGLARLHSEIERTLAA